MDPSAVEVEGLGPLHQDNYDGLDLNRLAVFVISLLRERNIPPSFEHIVVALFRLFPARFGLKGYPHPDANRVNRTLLQLGPKYRNWAVGSNSTGYALTAAGERVAAEVGVALKGDPGPHRPRSRGKASYTWGAGDDLLEIRNTAAFARFNQDGPASLEADDIWDALQAYPYTPPDAVRNRLIALRRYAADAGDVDLVQFLDRLRSLFDERVRPPSRR